jgi:hypothetical protein
MSDISFKQIILAFVTGILFLVALIILVTYDLNMKIQETNLAAVKAGLVQQVEKDKVIWVKAPQK